MNCDGAIAQQRWKRWRPAIYAAIGDPGDLLHQAGRAGGQHLQDQPTRIHPGLPRSPTA